MARLTTTFPGQNPYDPRNPHRKLTRTSTVETVVRDAAFLKRCVFFRRSDASRLPRSPRDVSFVFGAAISARSVAGENIVDNVVCATVLFAATEAVALTARHRRGECCVFSVSFSPVSGISPCGVSCVVWNIASYFHAHGMRPLSRPRNPVRSIVHVPSGMNLSRILGISEAFLPFLQNCFCRLSRCLYADVDPFASLLLWRQKQEAKKAKRRKSAKRRASGGFRHTPSAYDKDGWGSGAGDG